jgi:hypothetical protein
LEADDVPSYAFDVTSYAINDPSDTVTVPWAAFGVPSDPVDATLYAVDVPSSLAPKKAARAC